MYNFSEILLASSKTCTSPDHERCIGLIYNVRRSVSFSWNGFLDLKNICGFVLPQFGAVSLDLFPHLGQVQVQVLSEVIQAFFSTFLKLLVLHDLDQLLQQLEVGSLVSFFLFPDSALAVEHADTNEVDPLEWRRKCCFVGQELGLKYKGLLKGAAELPTGNPKQETIHFYLPDNRSCCTSTSCQHSSKPPLNKNGKQRVISVRQHSTNRMCCTSWQ